MDNDRFVLCMAVLAGALLGAMLTTIAALGCGAPGSHTPERVETSTAKPPQYGPGDMVEVNGRPAIVVTMKKSRQYDHDGELLGRDGEVAEYRLSDDQIKLIKRAAWPEPESSGISDEMLTEALPTKEAK